MLETADLCCVRGKRTLFDRLSWRAAPGTCVLVAGENGAGKTSLLRILTTQLAPDRGEVRWDGREIRALGEAFRARLAWVGHLNGIKDDLSALENLQLAAALAGQPASVVDATAALARLGLAGRARAAARQLSQGQKRRVALARLCLAAAAPLWILDEPFNALDASGVAIMLALIAEHTARGGIVVLTTHLEVTAALAPQRLDLDLAGAEAAR